MTSGYATNYCIKYNNENRGLDYRLHSRKGNKPVSLVDPKIVSPNTDLSDVVIWNRGRGNLDTDSFFDLE